MTANPVFVMERIEDLWDHIAYVAAYAPAGFPYEAELLPSQQMTLGLAFQQLHEGVEIAYPEPALATRRRQLHELLDRSLAVYREGEQERAAAMLAEFESIVFTPDGQKRGD